MEVLAWNAIVFAQVPFGLVPKVLDAIDVLSAPRDKPLGMIDPPMAKARDMQNIVAAERIGIDH